MIQSLAQFIYHESIRFLFGADRSGHHSWPPLLVCSVKIVLSSKEESQVGYIMIYGTSWNDEGTVINKSRNKMTKANSRIMGQWGKGQSFIVSVSVCSCVFACELDGCYLGSFWVHSCHPHFSAFHLDIGTHLFHPQVNWFQGWRGHSVCWL